MDNREVVLEVIAQVSGADRADLHPETELVAGLDMDSAKAVQLLVALEDHFGIEIEDEQVPQMATVGDVLALLDRVLA